MSGKYDDIRNHPYPFPTGRKRMTPLERAAQFSPFAALTGFDDAIRETEALSQSTAELAFAAACQGEDESDG